MTSKHQHASSGLQLEEIDWETTDDMIIFPELQSSDKPGDYSQRAPSVNAFDDEGWRLPEPASPPAVTPDLNQIDFKALHHYQTPFDCADARLGGGKLSPRQANPPIGANDTRLELQANSYPEHPSSAAHTGTNDTVTERFTRPIIRAVYGARPDDYCEAIQMERQAVAGQISYPRSQNTVVSYPLPRTITSLQIGNPVTVMSDGDIPGSKGMHSAAESAPAAHSSLMSRSAVSQPAAAHSARYHSISHPIRQAPTISRVQQYGLPYGLLPTAGHLVEDDQRRREPATKTGPTSIWYPPEVLALVAAIKTLESGPNGFPLRKHLKARKIMIIRQNFDSQLGVLRPQSILKRYAGDPVLFNAEYWAYLSSVQRRPRRMHAGGRLGQPS